MSKTAIVAWCNMKIAECDKEVDLAKMVGMERLAEPFARDARFFRAILEALGHATTDGVTEK